MKYGRRRRSAGFTKVGSVEPHKLEMPASRALDLQYQHAWERAAGPEIVSRLQFVRVFRRTLEIACVESHWSGPLRSILPLVAGRFAALVPGATIQKYCVFSDQSCGPARRIDEGPVATDRGSVLPEPKHRASSEDDSDERPTPDVESVARKYLVRHSGDNGTR
jgi:hypothetical protein